MNTLMKMKNGRLRAGLAAASLVLALAGCGGGAKDEHAGEKKEETATPKPS